MMKLLATAILTFSLVDPLFQPTGRSVRCNTTRRCAMRGRQPRRKNRPLHSESWGDIAPALADLTDRVLFGVVWERPQLSQRDRSLVTVSALIAMNRPDQLRSHMARARTNGVTQQELIEAITKHNLGSGGLQVSAVSAAIA